MPKATKSNLGQAAEFFVAADFLARGLDGTKPLNVNGWDDLHVKCSGRWFTVQVKHGTRNPNTGKLYSKSRPTQLQSDLLAIVHLPSKSIRYVSVKLPVPEELL